MSEESIFREIDEELRSDRMRALWRRYGPYVIGAAIAVVVLVAANEGWRWWQDTNAARSSDLLYQAYELLEAGDTAGAGDTLDRVVAEGSGGYPLLAQFRQAALLAEDGSTDEAVAAYDALANATEEKRLRELALLLGAYLLVDSGDVAAVEARVGGLAAADNPMRNAAREAIGLTQYAAGDIAGARTSFETVSVDPAAGLTQLQRIQLYLAQLAAEGAFADEAQETGAAEDAAAGAGSDAGQ